MTTPSDDNAGSPLWPGELRRELGAKYVQITQVAADAGLTEGQAAQVLKTLADIGTLQPWVAPECPECGHIWPAFLGEDDIPPSIHCPGCGEHNPRDEWALSLVYEVIGELPE